MANSNSIAPLSQAKLEDFISEDTLLGGGDDSIIGTVLDEEIRLGDGDDFAQGDGGRDYIRGGDGDDHMVADHDPYISDDQGNDILFGGSGDDVLVGDSGLDQAAGDAGADRFAVRSTGALSTLKVQDFETDHDQLRIDSQTAAVITDKANGVQIAFETDLGTQYVQLLRLTQADLGVGGILVHLY